VEPPVIRHGSVGRVMPGTEVKLVEGEVWVRGPHLMAGYLDNAEATAATIDADGWLHTGDLGRFDDDGFLYLGDRLKELIKVKGFQVAPAELEGLLRAHRAVADAAVVGVPDEEAGERPVAFVVARGELDRDELMAYVVAQVAPYKRLRGIEEVDALPRSPTGKLLRRMLVPGRSREMVPRRDRGRLRRPADRDADQQAVAGAPVAAGGGRDAAHGPGAGRQPADRAAAL
jgi:acyl-CoA synthetase (AMP-forming)/AMP-acid ligase II